MCYNNSIDGSTQRCCEGNGRDPRLMTVVELLMLTPVGLYPLLLGPPNTAHPMPVSTESVNM